MRTPAPAVLLLCLGLLICACPAGDDDDDDVTAADDDATGDDDDDASSDDDTTSDPCSDVPGVNSDGLCDDACGAPTPCDGVAPGTDLETCTGGGSHGIQDTCDAACQPVDQADMICRAVGVADCAGDPECDGVTADTGDCDHDCQYVGPDCDAPGRITVTIDGVTYFDRSTDIALRCLDLAFDSYQYGNGPPGAVIQPTLQQSGTFHADLIGFEDDHANCEEKWGFVYLEGDCADVLLEKWNWNVCNTEYHTDLMKLETWVDTDGGCDYSDAENDEPYSHLGLHWSSAHVYQLVITWE